MHTAITLLQDRYECGRDRDCQGPRDGEGASREEERWEETTGEKVPTDSPSESKVLQGVAAKCIDPQL